MEKDIWEFQLVYNMCEMRGIEIVAKQVELRQIELTTPDIDFIKLWLKSKDNPGVNHYIENLMFEIIGKYERADIKEIL